MRARCLLSCHHRAEPVRALSLPADTDRQGWSPLSTASSRGCTTLALSAFPRTRDAPAAPSPLFPSAGPAPGAPALSCPQEYKPRWLQAWIFTPCRDTPAPCADSNHPLLCPTLPCLCYNKYRFSALSPSPFLSRQEPRAASAVGAGALLAQARRAGGGAGAAGRGLSPAGAGSGAPARASCPQRMEPAAPAVSAARGARPGPAARPAPPRTAPGSPAAAPGMAAEGRARPARAGDAGRAGPGRARGARPRRGEPRAGRVPAERRGWGSPPDRAAPPRCSHTKGDPCFGTSLIGL